MNGPFVVGLIISVARGIQPMQPIRAGSSFLSLASNLGVIPNNDPRGSSKMGQARATKAFRTCRAVAFIQRHHVCPSCSCPSSLHSALDESAKVSTSFGHFINIKEHFHVCPTVIGDSHRASILSGLIQHKKRPFRQPRSLYHFVVKL